MDRIVCPTSMISKIGPCFMKQTNKVHIRSLLGNKNLDINENKMTNGNSIILYIHYGRENQIFYLVYNSDNTVTFKNKNYAIDVKNGEAKNGSVIQLYEYNDTLAQKFYLVDSGIGYVTIHSAINPIYVLDVKNGEDYDRNTKQLYKLNFTVAQRFKLVSPSKIIVKI